MSGSNIGGVDASIALQAGRGVQQTNPLQQVEQFVHASQGINALKMFPGQQQLQQQEIERGGVNNARLINQSVNQSLLPLLSLPEGTINHSNYTQALASAETRGFRTDRHVADLASLPQGDGPEFDRAVRARIASNSMVSPESSLNAVTPETRLINNGQVTAPVLIAPRGQPGQGNVTPAAGGVAQVLSPEFLAQQVGRPVTGEEAARLNVPPGTPITETMAQRLFSQGAGTLTGPAGAAMGGASSPFQNGGRLPPALMNPNKPQGAGSPTTMPSSAVGAPVVAGMAPGQADYMGGQAAPAQAVAQRVATFQTDMFPLMQAQKAIAAAPTGKGSEAVHAASSYINTFAPEFVQKAISFVSPLMTKDEVTAYDEARKYLTQSQLGVSGAGRSDQGLSTAGAASPSTQISKEAAQVVLKGMVALRRMEQDEGQSWIAAQKAGAPVSKFNDFRSDFQKQADPRVYTFDQMSPAQRRETLTSFGKDEQKRAAFMASVARAERNGVMAPPQ